jgi:hypothetical protein
MRSEERAHNERLANDRYREAGRDKHPLRSLRSLLFCILYFSCFIALVSCHYSRPNLEDEHLSKETRDSLAYLYERYNMGQADEATVKNTPFYCLLKVRIYNKDCDLGEEGGLMLDRYSLMGDNYMALVSENVFCTMYPDMPGTSFSLRKGTSMEFELPYPITRTEGCTKEDMQKKAPMLEISEFPNRKLLKAG